MKIWNSYGAEHSLNLVIIGHFKEPSDAKEFKDFVEKTASFLSDQDDFEVEADRYSSGVLDYLSDKNMHSLTPQQLGHFLYDYSIDISGSDVTVSSDDDLHGFISLMVHHGAKIEVFSAHNYPNEDNEG